MPLDIDDAAQPVSNASTAPAYTATRLLIDGVQREAVSMVADGKTIVRTKRLSFQEEIEVGSAQDEKHDGRPATIYHMAIATVRQIDGVGIPFPSSQANLNALISELGDDGARAVLKDYQKSVAALVADAKNAPAAAASI